MNNQCENYVKRYNNGGLKPCEKPAQWALLYYNELEDMAKAFFLCQTCYADYSQKNHEHISNVKSKVVELDTLKP